MAGWSVSAFLAKRWPLMVKWERETSLVIPSEMFGAPFTPATGNGFLASWEAM